MRECTRVLRGTSKAFTPREALRMLAHLVGDVHQPLHSGNSFINASGALRFVLPEGPTGWRSTTGGNALVYGPQDRFNLHSYWDTHIVNLAMQQDDVATYAARLVKEVPVAPDWTSPGDPDTWPERWTNDSLVYAKEAHQDIRLTTYLGPDDAGRVPHRWRIEQPAGYDERSRAVHPHPARQGRLPAGRYSESDLALRFRREPVESASPHAPVRWHARRPLRHPRAARRGRHGRGVSRDGHQAEAPGRGEDPARSARGRPRPAGALSARSRSPRLAQSPTHRGHLRARRRPFDRLRARGREGARDGARRRPDPRRPHCAGADPDRRGAGDRETNRRSAGSGARARHHPSRSEAGQHQSAGGRHREGAGLRAGEAHGARERAGMDGRICHNPRP